MRPIAQILRISTLKVAPWRFPNFSADRNNHVVNVIFLLTFSQAYSVFEAGGGAATFGVMRRGLRDVLHLGNASAEAKAARSVHLGKAAPAGPSKTSLASCRPHRSSHAFKTKICGRRSKLLSPNPSSMSLNFRMRLPVRSVQYRAAVEDFNQKIVRHVDVAV